MLITHLKDTFPSYAMQPPAIGDLQTFYKVGKWCKVFVLIINIFIRNPKFGLTKEDFKKRAYKAVVDLQNHEPEVIKAWQLICGISRQGIKSN